ncbi:putative membrane protein [uncultured spirochete]|uniref:Putative membrane protein n=1 Tax=uncultured spirochete TaxID=156406 RepID=A0A3P3XT24_9SPIR|nr:putative membrane protein [uncultured spirochete]
MKTPLLMTILFSILPISELRGAIPYAVYNGFSIPLAAAISIAANVCVPLIAFLFLESFHKLFYKIKPYKKFFDRFVENARKRVHGKVEKYGYWGLLIFVAVPLPVTGAWTGALGAWVLGLSYKKAFFAIAGGVVVAGIIVSVLVALWGVGTQTIFFKTMH